jgi:hypothetical protein
LQGKVKIPTATWHVMFWTDLINTHTNEHAHYFSTKPLFLLRHMSQQETGSSEPAAKTSASSPRCQLITPAAISMVFLNHCLTKDVIFLMCIARQSDQTQPFWNALHRTETCFLLIICYPDSNKLL